MTVTTTVKRISLDIKIYKIHVSKINITNFQLNRSDKTNITMEKLDWLFFGDTGVP